MEITKVNLDDAYNGSYYTIIGAGGDLQEWTEWYDEKLSELKIGKPKAWFTCKGSDVNEEYGLTGNNRYKDDLTFLFFPLDNLQVGLLAMFKMKMGNRWLDDVVNNNAMREEET